MKTALLADIQGNGEGLRAVLRACRERAVDAYLCLGGILGLGPDVEECLECAMTFDGCTCSAIDKAVVHGPDAIISTAKNHLRAAEWSCKRLSVDQREWLAELPRRSECHGIRYGLDENNEGWQQPLHFAWLPGGHLSRPCYADDGGIPIPITMRSSEWASYPPPIFPGSVTTVSELGMAHFVVVDGKSIEWVSCWYDPRPIIRFLRTESGASESYVQLLEKRAVMDART